MSRIPLQLPEFTGVGVNAKGTLDVTLGNAIHDITIQCQTAGVDMTVAQMKSMIDLVTVKLNGKPVQEFTPTTLDILNKTNGAQYGLRDGFLTLFFYEPWNRTMEGEERGAWGTAGLDSFTVEIKTNGTAVSPTFKASAWVDEGNRSIRLFPVRHVRNYDNLPVVAGTQGFPGLLREVGLFYRRLHFVSALISKVQIRTNKVTKWDDIPRATVAEWMTRSGLSLQTGVYTVAFDLTSKQLTDQLASFLATNPPVIVPDFSVNYTGTGAGLVNVVTEQYQFLA